MWIFQVESIGINEVRKILGYHDEPLKGDRQGQRSVRLSRSYRAFYVEYKETKKDEEKTINIVNVLELESAIFAQSHKLQLLTPVEQI